MVLEPLGVMVMVLLLLSVFFTSNSQPAGTLLAAGRVRAQPADAADASMVRLVTAAV